MGYWRFGNDITVDGGAYVNLKELILDRSEDAIKLFTDEELEELKENKENDIILSDDEKLALNNYISSDSYKINENLEKGLIL